MADLTDSLIGGSYDNVVAYAVKHDFPVLFRVVKETEDLHVEWHVVLSPHILLGLSSLPSRYQAQIWYTWAAESLVELYKADRRPGTVYVRHELYVSHGDDYERQ